MPSLTSVQVGLIVFGMAIAIPYSINYAGGWSNVVNNVPRNLGFVPGIGGIKSIVALVIMYVSTFTVGQEAVSRYYSARDGKAAKARVNTVSDYKRSIRLYPHHSWNCYAGIG